jgi:hypothetical protein
MDSQLTAVERIIVPHEAFKQGRTLLDQLYKYASGGSDAEGIAILGESGTGKTTLLKQFIADHKLKRGDDGVEGHVLYASVPSTPTVGGLAGVMLQALGTEDWDRGTEIQKTQRLTKLIDEVGILVIVIDEFNHFIERRSGKVLMYQTADWLKKLIDDTGRTLVVSGLPSCRAVIDQNEQLTRRFLAPIQLPRFSWNDKEQRKQFQIILKAFYKEVAKEYSTPEYFSNGMAFRFYCATGGLIGYVSKLLKQALRNAIMAGSQSIELDGLHEAFLQTVWRSAQTKDLPRPFEEGFTPAETVDLLERVARIGVRVEPPQERKPRAPKKDQAA